MNCHVRIKPYIFNELKDKDIGEFFSMTIPAFHNRGDVVYVEPDSDEYYNHVKVEVIRENSLGTWPPSTAVDVRVIQ